MASTEKRAEALIEQARCDGFAAGSRNTLTHIYKGCEDEAMVLYISHLIGRRKRPAPTSPEFEAVRARAVDAAHDWARRSGPDFTIDMRPAGL